MTMSETLSLQAALDLVEAATTTSGEELEANLPQLVALFHLPVRGHLLQCKFIPLPLT